MSSGGLDHRLPARKGRGFVLWPTTRLGKWAVVLAAASFMLLSGWSFVGRLGGVPGLLFGLAGGVFALVAVFRQGERALTVFAALVPFLSVVGFVLVSLLLDD